MQRGRGSRNRRSAAGAIVLAIWVGLGPGCGADEAPIAKSPQTLAIEKEAGDFLDYYAEVLRLAQEHAAEPDSFRIALDALPGTHLDEEAWSVWTQPYRDDPRRFSDRLERIIAERKTTP